MVFLYFTFFACVAGGAFALMWSNVRNIYWEKPSTRSKHPEAPEEGDELLYVDLSREKLEELYQND
jgi:hypothetical protein